MGCLSRTRKVPVCVAEPGLPVEQMPYFMGIYWAGSLENGIHALPILSNGQTLWAGYLGTPVSFGCIILSTENARTLYYWTEVGTPVVVQW